MNTPLYYNYKFLVNNFNSFTAGENHFQSVAILKENHVRNKARIGTLTTAYVARSG